MANSQPLICTSIRYPPDQQLFSRLAGIPFVFLEKLDDLDSALAITLAKHPSPEAMKIFQDIRTLAGNKANTLSYSVFRAPAIAERYLDLIEALRRKNDYRDPLFFLKSGGMIGNKVTDASQRAMSEIKEGLASAISQIGTVMNARRWRWVSKAPMFGTDNIEAISEIYNAIDECSRVLEECRDYFKKTIKQASDFPESDPPSEEEIQVMGEKWEAFRLATKDLTLSFYPVTESIKSSPNPLRHLPDCSAAATSSRPSTNKPGTPTFRRKFSRRPPRSNETDSSNTSNAPSPQPSPGTPSRRKFFWRPSFISMKTFQ